MTKQDECPRCGHPASSHQPNCKAVGWCQCALLHGREPRKGRWIEEVDYAVPERWEYGSLVGGGVKRKTEWTGEAYGCFFVVAVPVLLILLLIMIFG